MSKRIVAIAPGRGTYNRTELNYLKRFEDNPRFEKRMELLALADSLRSRAGRITVSELDGAEAYSPRTHLPGENASPLIFTASAADFATLDPAHKVCAVLGNSMGWYTTLYTGGALDFEETFKVVDGMGWLQKDNLIGGQVIYPLVDDQWRADAERAQAAQALVADIASRGEDHWVGLSINLGGFAVYAGTNTGIRTLLAELPKVKVGANEYPFQLPRHSAFHTHMMAEASEKGQYLLNNISWGQPRVPMIDGRGAIWRPGRATRASISSYTLGHQVLEPYDFTASVRVALREYNPDHLVLLGPGETLGGAIAHVIIAEGWRGIHSKADFVAAQKGAQPPLISMNRPEQAALVI